MADDPDDPKHAGVNPDLLKLPIGAISAGDPVNGNPFSPGTARHNIWHRATREAEKRLARCRVAYLTLNELLSQIPPGAPGGREIVIEKRLESECELFCYQFDIWAWRSALVVDSDADIKGHDERLASYAKFMLKAASKLAMSHAVPLAVNDAWLLRLRGRLLIRVNHWEAEARELTKSRPPEPPILAERADKKVGGPKLAKWLATEMRNRAFMTENRLHELTDLDRKTIKKMLAGKPVRAVRLDKLAQGLEIAISEIPTD